MHAQTRLVCIRGALALALFVAGTLRPARALTIVELHYSTDTTVSLDGVDVDDEQWAVEDAATANVTAAQGLFNVPQADVVGLDGTAAPLISVDTTVGLPCGGGNPTIEPGDVFDTGTCTILFSSTAAGLPNSAIVDAITTIGDDLLLSFDTTVTIFGVTADDEDLVRIPAGGGSASLFFDGAAQGVPPALDLDAAHRLSNGVLLLSFDGSGTIAGVDFDDEDVVSYDPMGPGTWNLRYDNSSRHAALAAADLDALVAVELPPTATVTPANTPTQTPTVTSTQTPSLTPTITHSATPTRTPSSVPTDTPSPMPTRTSSTTPTIVPTMTPTITPPATLTPSLTVPPTQTATSTRTHTDTPEPTSTFTPVPTTSSTPTRSTPTRTPATPPPCTGDCDANHAVTVDELVRGVGIALGTLPPEACPALDRNADGNVTIDELIAAVNHALSGCS